MATLFMMNVPHNCSETELTLWVESTGVRVRSVRMIRDLVSGVSPAFAYVDLGDEPAVADAVTKLNGHTIRDRVIVVSQTRRGAPAA